MAFWDAINGLFQAAKRRACGFMRMSTIKTDIFLIAGKCDQPSCYSTHLQQSLFGTAEKLVAFGHAPTGGTSAQFQAIIQREVGVWAKLGATGVFAD